MTFNEIPEYFNFYPVVKYVENERVTVYKQVEEGSYDHDSVASFHNIGIDDRTLFNMYSVSELHSYLLNYNTLYFGTDFPIIELGYFDILLTLVKKNSKLEHEIIYNPTEAQVCIEKGIKLFGVISIREEKLTPLVNKICVDFLKTHNKLKLEKE